MKLDRKPAACVRSSGVTILEIVFGLLIFGILAATATRFLFRSPVDRRQTFVTQLNSLVRDAWLDTLKNSTMHRVVFNFDKRTVTVEKARNRGPVAIPAAESFVPVKQRTVRIPPLVDMRGFVIEGKDLMGGEKTVEAYFLIDHAGAFQDVKLVLGEEKLPPLTVRFNPFLKEFRTESSEP